MFSFTTAAYTYWYVSLFTDYTYTVCHATLHRPCARTARSARRLSEIHDNADRPAAVGAHPATVGYGWDSTNTFTWRVPTPGGCPSCHWDTACHSGWADNARVCGKRFGKHCLALLSHVLRLPERRATDVERAVLGLAVGWRAIRSLGARW